ncbi:nucleotide exchange factor GrpE [Flavobacteriaceae bacterium KMM 6897]|nr:nucleotide exchange factor GrpE [Flavobacteriaceae bacterium KMM 6897]MEB8344689.1 nucleotide exchange factor GrpE [Flavobacteriaceae bacterium KMM 6898]
MSKKNKAEEMEEMVSDAQTNDGMKDTEANDGGDNLESLVELTTEEQLQEDLSKEKDKFLRLFAEFENYKRRTSKERMELFKTAGQEVIVSLLPVIDDFERAMKELAKSDDKEMYKGIELINNKFNEILKGKGLQELEVKQGDSFDAELHDAITQIPAPDKKLKGKIIDVIEKGFTLGDKIIRHPKVVVGN